MSRKIPLLDAQPGDWRYVLFGVGVGLLVSLASAAAFGGDPTSGWLFWSGLAAGYLCKRRGLRSSPVGFRVGLVASLWAVGKLFVRLDGTGAETETAGLGFLGALVVGVPLLVGFLCLIGTVGARIGGWLAERGGHPGSTPVDA